MLIIHKPEGLEKEPHHWTIEDDTGMFVFHAFELVPEAREEQARIIEQMVYRYNLE